MNGFSYILFVTVTQPKDIGPFIGVSPQMITNWKNGIKPIASKHLPSLSSYFGVEKHYFQKELTLQDKVEIELQLSSKTGEYESFAFQAAELHKQNQAVKEKYYTLLDAIKQNERSFSTVESHAKDVYIHLLELLRSDIIVEQPAIGEKLSGILHDIQRIRKEVKM